MRHRAFAVMVCLSFAVGTVVVSPPSAVAQSTSAYAIVPKLPNAIAVRSGERLTLGQVVNLVLLLPSPIVSVAVAGADGGVRLNGTAGVTTSTLAELLSTVVTATSDGTVTLVIDARVNVGSVTVDSRSVGVLSLKFIASPTRYRVTPRESPFRMNAGSVYRLGDLVTFEKLDPNSLIQNFGFEVNGGVVCLASFGPPKPAPCPRVSTNIYPVYTESMLASRFTASASGRITFGIYVSALTGGGDPIEKFVIDVEVNGLAARQGLVASTDAPGPASTTRGATDPAPTTLAPDPGTALPSAPPNSQNTAATTAKPGSSSSGRPTVTTRPKPKPKPKPKLKAKV